MIAIHSRVYDYISLILHSCNLKKQERYERDNTKIDMMQVSFTDLCTSQNNWVIFQSPS